MVTVNGAKSVLWDDELGSLEVGKKVGIGSDYLAINYLEFVLILLTYKKILDS
jgi:hypothetical protein